MATHGATVRFTYQDYLNLPEESRYEILDGDLLMSPSPSKSHQKASIRLSTLLERFVQNKNLGEVYAAPFDVILSDIDVVQPDVFFVSKGRASIVRENGVFGGPDLVIEILSPGTAERDRTVKAKLYARAGVAELWLVDPDAKTIEILTNSPGGFHRHAFGSGAEAVRSVVLPDLEIRASEIF